MLKTLSEAAGFALSLVATLSLPLHADIPIPDQCWPYCDSVPAWNAECQNWFGSAWYYCGYSAGWVYCCGPGYPA